METLSNSIKKVTVSFKLFSKLLIHDWYFLTSVSQHVIFTTILPAPQVVLLPASWLDQTWWTFQKRRMMETKGRQKIYINSLQLLIQDAVTYLKTYPHAEILCITLFNKDEHIMWIITKCMHSFVLYFHKENEFFFIDFILPRAVHSLQFDGVHNYHRSNGRKQVNGWLEHSLWASDFTTYEITFESIECSLYLKETEYFGYFFQLCCLLCRHCWDVFKKINICCQLCDIADQNIPCICKQFQVEISCVCFKCILHVVEWSDGMKIYEKKTNHQPLTSQ